MYSFSSLIHNDIFMSAALGWLVAQILKTLIYAALNHTFRTDRLFGSGGMPSSHSATVCALCSASLITYGLGSFEFAITFFFAFIAMYDAIGVRWETGEQAKLLNKMMHQFQHLDKVFTDQKELKEFVGHTPLQVLCGGILGIIIASIYCALF